MARGRMRRRLNHLAEEGAHNAAGPPDVEAPDGAVLAKVVGAGREHSS